MWKSIFVVDTIGSEGGIIVADEEYNKSCRITLEKCEKHYAITCGIYGAMVHTTFSDFEYYQIKYDTMKKELQDFLERKATIEEELDFYDYFCNKY